MMKRFLLPALMIAVAACTKEMPEMSMNKDKELPKEQSNEKPKAVEGGEGDLSVSKENKPTDLLSLEKYYATKFSINQEFVQRHFMQGVFENVSGFLGEILVFDETKYKPGAVMSKNSDMRRNSFTVTFKVYDVEDHSEYVEITKDFSGFKTVDTLIGNLKLSPRQELLEIVRKALGKKDFSADLAKALEGNFVNKNWMQYVDYTYKGELLELQEIQKRNGKDQVIKGNGDYLDVYLVNPRWKLQSAVVKDTDLHLTVKLEMVNLFVLSDVTFQLIVKGLV